MGCSTALALQRRGFEVTLVEQFEVGHDKGSSHGGSRHIRYLEEHQKYIQFIPHGELEIKDLTLKMFKHISYGSNWRENRKLSCLKILV